MFLTPTQLQYARDDVRYLLPLQTKLEAELAEAGLTKVYELVNSFARRLLVMPY
jgi:ribonuclease D